MKKGIVMSIDEDFLTVLTAEGEFLRARKQEDVEIGEELTFFPVSLSEKTRSRSWFNVKAKRNVFSVIGTLAAIILIITFIPMFATTKQVYAYVSIDINPSLEIGVDDELQVLSITALNQDGEKLLSTLPKWKEKHIDLVSKMIIDHSVESGYLDQGDEVLITTVVNDAVVKAQDDIIEVDLQQFGEEYQKESNIVVTTIHSTKEIREKAKKQGVSTGKLIQQEKKEQEKVKEEAVQKNVTQPQKTQPKANVQTTGTSQKSTENEQKSEKKESPPKKQNVSNSTKNEKQKNEKNSTKDKKYVENEKNKKQKEKHQNHHKNSKEQATKENKGPNHGNKDNNGSQHKKDNNKRPDHAKGKGNNHHKEVPANWNRNKDGK
ncbi:anti-sigma factor domain-containing protein [Bacillus sp. PS06]|uniref:anti-sigma factor domain-containing protein n=1 Tax=Bacillus sp. PS06 TaxID=2764176 RepID=UPI001782C61B|nr:anti-sigma factor domain-containing protein [Bacillus sp. PS06]MBD8067448.1 anti-sigma factor domain-containing protein [Bacillus sp. PS06]